MIEEWAGRRKEGSRQRVSVQNVYNHLQVLLEGGGITRSRVIARSDGDRRFIVAENKKKVGREETAAVANRSGREQAVPEEDEGEGMRNKNPRRMSSSKRSSSSGDGRVIEKTLSVFY
ncbi:hypothetical protein L2E82_10295 [Cichorium intybus]|uniref:Uncharacterized protein n=1 Tax=Cichorium intybus TaxID=13427 RepID=A0ACB9GB73_CICIN|nr:hypothetical protein L2E82_10295 [Cichorium intybus]